ncbi:MAG TPA: hypothetical protein VJN32_01670 [Dehalococcoidia bacterium]|nr:hypothetical protein [Dehalococcoidia bacterium]
MSCYVRHLGEVLAVAGIPDSRESRRRVHAMVQEITGEQNCPRVWRRAKAALASDAERELLIAALRERWQRAG